MTRSGCRRDPEVAGVTRRLIVTVVAIVAAALAVASVATFVLVRVAAGSRPAPSSAARPSASPPTSNRCRPQAP